MPKNSSSTKRKRGKLSKGLSIDQDLIDAVNAVAERESRSFAYIVRRAIERDLALGRVTPSTASVPQCTDELISITEVGKILHLSVWTIRRRARKTNDPLRLAKSKIGKQKPMHFVRSRIEQMERAA